ncbi:hypothetical protein GCM10022198_13850 [Klugiella xanthotipulae]
MDEVIERAGVSVSETSQPPAALAVTVVIRYLETSPGGMAKLTESGTTAAAEVELVFGAGAAVESRAAAARASAAGSLPVLPAGSAEEMPDCPAGPVVPGSRVGCRITPGLAGRIGIS